MTCLSFKRITLLLLLALLVLSTACSREEQPAPAGKPQETPVVVPQEVAESWKAVKVAALDLTDGRERVFIVDVGGEFTIPDSGLTVKVRYFLPSFVRAGKGITSASNKLDNPAVMIRVSENGQEIYSGWLFGMYPEAHNFRHSRFALRLAGQIPAQKKG